MSDSFWGEPISVYSEQQGVEDGILMQNPSILFCECNLLTANLWSHIQDCGERNSEEPVALLNIIMLQASFIYTNNLFTGDHDEDFFTLEVPSIEKPIWFARNGTGKLPALLAEDY